LLLSPRKHSCRTHDISYLTSLVKYAATLNDEALSETTPPDFELQYIDIGNVDSSGATRRPDGFIGQVERPGDFISALIVIFNLKSSLKQIVERGRWQKESKEPFRIIFCRSSHMDSGKSLLTSTFNYD
jgi:hypothetical protein